MQERQVTENDGNLIESYVSLSLSFGAECRVMTAKGKRKLTTTEMRMLLAHVTWQNPKR